MTARSIPLDQLFSREELHTHVTVGQLVAWHGWRDAGREDVSKPLNLYLVKEIVAAKRGVVMDRIECYGNSVVENGIFIQPQSEGRQDYWSIQPSSANAPSHPLRCAGCQNVVAYVWHRTTQEEVWCATCAQSKGVAVL